ncbi:hypothetical protein BURPS1710A_2317 [Burkholderia pseudomallei 1710a]|uniref:Uncharacterized protein n=1 Tax=Burkholderia pseudomallei 1710a TaxID=320371 RepID=A0A0E1W0R1_BURPE|nr:hypothetical protein BURPS1710A_2317 [Burkholderia pseudomallei 1710a]
MRCEQQRDDPDDDAVGYARRTRADDGAESAAGDATRKQAECADDARATPGKGTHNEHDGAKPGGDSPHSGLAVRVSPFGTCPFGMRRCEYTRLSGARSDHVYSDSMRFQRRISRYRCRPLRTARIASRVRTANARATGPDAKTPAGAGVIVQSNWG